MDGDGELDQEAAPCRALHVKQPGGCSAGASFINLLKLLKVWLRRLELRAPVRAWSFAGS